MKKKKMKKNKKLERYMIKEEIIKLKECKKLSEQERKIGCVADRVARNDNQE
jgi:hypothetical protein